MFWKSFGATSGGCLGVLFVLLLMVAIPNACSDAQAQGTRYAEAISQSIKRAADGAARCRVLSLTKTISCIVNKHTTPDELDQMAQGIVFTVRMQDIPMDGWRLTLVSADDDVVQVPF